MKYSLALIRHRLQAVHFFIGEVLVPIAREYNKTSKRHWWCMCVCVSVGVCVCMCVCVVCVCVCVCVCVWCCLKGWHSHPKVLFKWLCQPRPRCDPKKRWRDALRDNLKQHHSILSQVLTKMERCSSGQFETAPLHSVTSVNQQRTFHQEVDKSGRQTQVHPGKDEAC